MALPVAIQSVVFYYLACTPCMSARTRHRAKKKFDKERKERAALEEDEPPLYRHPSPFNVNPYWQEEIMMGPSLPKKGRAAKQNSSQRKLTSAGKDSSIATRSSLAISNHGGAPNSSGGGILQGGSGGSDPLPTGAAAATGSEGTSATVPGTQVDGSAGDNSTPSSNNASGANVTGNNADANANTNAGNSRTSGGQPPSSPTLIPDDARSMSMLEATATAATVGTTTTSSAEGWNYKRYQREDEELWGSEPSRTHKFMDAIVKAGSSAGRLLESTLGSKERGASSTGTGAYYNGGSNAVTDQDRANFYSPTIIHPPVNDYHPPVVGSKPAHKDALRWMLQPPPPAKVMEGKVPVSRSTSVASSMNGGSMRRSAATTAGAGAGSEVSLTRKMALEARLRRGDSTNSGATVTGRPHASSSTSVEDEAVLHVAAAAATANLSRSVSRKSGETRPKSQQRLGSRGASAAAAARSRSGSLASSVEDPNWSSDEDGGMLRTKWRFPGSAPPPIPAMPAMPSLPATAVLSGSNGDGGLQSRSSLHMNNSQNPSRAKLETILSSDASGKMDMSRNSSNSRKENKRPEILKSPATSSSTVVGTAAGNGNGDATKAPHDRSAGSSLDSGLALSS